MNTIQKLDSIFIEYTKLKDNIKVTRKVVNSENKQLLSKTYLASEQIQDIQIDLQNLIVHIEEWFFVTAWAVFERGLIEFFHKKMDVINSVTPMTFGEKLKEKNHS